jgi:hypothetical protein
MKIAVITLKEMLVRLIYESDVIKQQMTFNEQLEMCDWVIRLQEEELCEIAEELFGLQEQETHPGEPKKPTATALVIKVLDIGFAVACVILPGGMAVLMATNYLKNAYNYRCAIKCRQAKDVSNKKLCYAACHHEAVKIVLKRVERDIKDCPRTKKPEKCHKKMLKIISKWRVELKKAELRLDVEVKRTKAEYQKKKKTVAKSKYQKMPGTYGLPGLVD